MDNCIMIRLQKVWRLYEGVNIERPRYRRVSVREKLPAIFLIAEEISVSAVQTSSGSLDMFGLAFTGLELTIFALVAKPLRDKLVIIKLMKPVEITVSIMSKLHSNHETFSKAISDDEIDHDKFMLVPVYSTNSGIVTNQNIVIGCDTSVPRTCARSDSIEPRASDRSDTSEFRPSDKSDNSEFRPSDRSDTSEPRTSARSDSIEPRTSDRSDTIEFRPSDKSDTSEFKPSDRSDTSEPRTSARSDSIEPRASDRSDTSEFRPSDRSDTSEFRPSDRSDTSE
ncbi:hypothetical protein CHS0354_029344 [Potamilus streckersoni]|uniref:Uncharacterized protein n=1 Tax=Potamilus streckersoni TaxID=2493646 RepID=A0AAE0T370_9BIVA|nr:hypothetical protein CHS0354_029344 [Potamilus streckersoni]